MSRKGGVTIPVFHCVFNGYDSITSYMRDYDEGMYKILDNLYAVCVSDNSGSKRKIVAGFIVKTSYTHNDSEFFGAITEAAQSAKELSQYLGSNASFLPARIGVKGSSSLSESEMLEVMSQQSLKFNVGGNA